jgi:cyclopropane-fatty-acyl-phospholipid synthase
MARFHDYWETMNSSGHRGGSDEFYLKKSMEHSQIIDPLDRQSDAIDIGCGAGELLKFLKGLVNISQGLDFSASMLVEARENNPDIDFIQSDFTDYLPSCDLPVWLACESVNQYIDATGQKKIMDFFLANPKVHSFYMFDTIEPSRYVLRSGSRLLDYNSGNKFSFTRSLYGVIKLLLITVFSFRSLDFMRLGVMGYGYSPGFWIREARKRNLRIEIVSSKYYEYRYHIILRK